MSQGVKDQQTKVHMGFHIPAIFGKGKAWCHKKKWLITEVRVALSDEEISPQAHEGS